MVYKIIPAENLWWLYAILVAGGLMMVFGYLVMVRESKQSGVKNRWVLKIRFVLPFTATAMLMACWMVYQQATATLEISDTSVIIHAGFYDQEIIKSSLQLNEAKIISLSKSSQLQPVHRMNGTGAPSLKAGWFGLRNGEKAFLLVTDPDNVLYLPTSDYVLLLSLENPEGFLAHLKK